MKRRALLQGALGMPVIGGIGYGLTQSDETAAAADTRALLSGLASLDYALGGVAAGELACVTSPPYSGKTSLLLDWAARVCNRYRKNIVFYSANEPSFGIARKSVVKGRVPLFFAGETLHLDRLDRDIGSSGAIIMVDARGGDLKQAQALATWLKANNPAGCAALISDGWSTTKRRPLSGLAFDAEPWVPTLMSVESMSEAAEFARVSGLPVVIGVQTASLVDDDALADSLHLSLQLRQSAARWLAMTRPELYVDSDRAVPADKNVVQLCGRSANWWDTRRSRLRFDDRQRVFETVV